MRAAPDRRVEIELTREPPLHVKEVLEGTLASPYGCCGWEGWLLGAEQCVPARIRRTRGTLGHPLDDL